MKNNVPILTLVPRIWLLLVFAILTNTAALTNHPIIDQHWEHTYSESHHATNGEWVHGNEETWTLVPAKTLFDMLGAALYVPAIVSLAALCWATVMHFHFRRTVDAYIHSGDFAANFTAARPELKLMLTAALLCCFFLGICWIAASVGK